jgi:hypothetical protein
MVVVVVGGGGIPSLSDHDAPSVLSLGREVPRDLRYPLSELKEEWRDVVDYMGYGIFLSGHVLPLQIELLKVLCIGHIVNLMNLKKHKADNNAKAKAFEDIREDYIKNHIGRTDFFIGDDNIDIPPEADVELHHWADKIREWWFREGRKVILEDKKYVLFHCNKGRNRSPCALGIVLLAEYDACKKKKKKKGTKQRIEGLDSADTQNNSISSSSSSSSSSQATSPSAGGDHIDKPVATPPPYSIANSDQRAKDEAKGVDVDSRESIVHFLRVMRPLGAGDSSQPPTLANSRFARYLQWLERRVL